MELGNGLFSLTKFVKSKVIGKPFYSVYMTDFIANYLSKKGTKKKEDEANFLSFKKIFAPPCLFQNFLLEAFFFKKASRICVYHRYF